MARFAKALAGLSVACAVVSFAVVGGAVAGGGNSIAAKACQQGGWASPNLQDGIGQPLGITFSSEEECVAFGARGGEVFNPSLVGDPSHVGEGEESFWIASGFHPNSLGTVTVQNIGASGSITLPAMTTAKGGLPKGVGTLITSGPCASGLTGVEVTLVDGEGVHASTIISVDCP